MENLTKHFKIFSSPKKRRKSSKMQLPGWTFSHLFSSPKKMMGMTGLGGKFCWRRGDGRRGRP